MPHPLLSSGGRREESLELLDIEPDLHEDVAVRLQGGLVFLVGLPDLVSRLAAGEASHQLPLPITHASMDREMQCHAVGVLKALRDHVIPVLLLLNREELGREGTLGQQGVTHLLTELGRPQELEIRADFGQGLVVKRVDLVDPTLQDTSVDGVHHLLDALGDIQRRGQGDDGERECGGLDDNHRG